MTTTQKTEIVTGSTVRIVDADSSSHGLVGIVRNIHPKGSKKRYFVVFEGRSAITIGGSDLFSAKQLEVIVSESSTPNTDIVRSAGIGSIAVYTGNLCGGASLVKESEEYWNVYRDGGLSGAWSNAEVGMGLSGGGILMVFITRNKY